MTTGRGGVAGEPAEQEVTRAPAGAGSVARSSVIRAWMAAAGFVLMAGVVPLAAQDCPALAPGDSVRVTRTFWTPRPEFGIETRSQQIEFGEVETLTPDTLRYRVDEGTRAVAPGDSVAVARRCLVDPGEASSVGRHTLVGAGTGAGIGVLLALCGEADLEASSFQACDWDGAGSAAALIGVGIVVGAAVGFAVGLSRNPGPEWTWVDGTGQEQGSSATLLLGPVAGRPGGSPAWRIGVSLRR